MNASGVPKEGSEPGGASAEDASLEYERSANAEPSQLSTPPPPTTRRHLEPPIEVLVDDADDNVDYTPAERPYDPEPGRDKVRNRLALAIFSLFAVVIGAFMAPVILGYRSWQDLEGMAASIIPTVAAVFSAAVVFFYQDSRKR